MSFGRLRKNIFLRWPAARFRAASAMHTIGGCIYKPTAIIVVLCAVAWTVTPVKAEDPDISSRRATERRDFTNDEIREGFFKIAFRAELQVGRPAERVRKFDEPVRIFVDGKPPLARRATMAAIVADIRRRVDHLDVAITADRDEANFVVMLVADRDVAATIRSRYGRGRAAQIEKSLAPQCLSSIAKDNQFRIRRAEAILPVDADDFTFFDCAYEEILQGLGVINDDPSVPWTMFNDDVQMGFFDVYDQYLLNILYDPRIRPGMTRSEVGARLSGVLATTRVFVSRINAADRAASRASTEAAQAAPSPKAN
jgi:hypothetical protein